ncbi:MAG: tryptophan--tRNA ligase [Bacteroidales bacterium]|jgi:tryptophanyl-tRNA synthetase|nr:tryptophan--tRNA ligase [Bacteroidales bacterium]MDD4545298.1 tryptophan--tRNA ligase [Bacteroidales bacterium]
METIVSGMRPTGNLHLGSYFGALKNFIRLQEEHNCYFFIADYHSLTTHPNPKDLHNNVKTILAQYLALGLDPQKATIYIQSQLPEIAELYMFLNMNAYLGELERVTSFKDKVRQNPNNVNAGLLTYPTLMAADIIIHKATKVPVGKDQEQHLEMTRTFAGRFNNMYKVDYFPEPKAFNFEGELVKVPGLDGSGKMGKSEGEGNAIFFVDEPEVLRKKIMRAKTDSGPTSPNQEKPQEIQNLFSLMKLVSPMDTVSYFEEAYNNCSIRYGDMKKQLAVDMIEFTSPYRERIKEVESDMNYLREVVELGSEKARESARKTISEVREIIGFKKF